MSGATGSRPVRGRRLIAAAAALGLAMLPLPAPAQPVSPGPAPAPSGAATPSPSAGASGPGATSASASSPQGAPSLGPASAPGDLGLRLYQQRCAWCHGQRGEGSPRAPTLIGVGAAASDFMLTTGRMPYQNERAFLLHHRPVFRPDEIRALDDQVSSFGGGGPEIPLVGSGHSPAGRRLFQQHCAACHSSTGAGGALTDGRIAPPLFQATATQVGEAIRVGPYVMPLFDESVLSPGDVNDLAAYVQVLRNKPEPLDRGGLSLGRIGPFSEGAVAWGLGILLLVLFARLLGNRIE